MPIGTVKHYNNQKGFGFIRPDGGDQDIFVHATALERAGLHALNEGDRVTFDVGKNPRTGKIAAENVRLTK